MRKKDTYQILEEVQKICDSMGVKIAFKDTSAFMKFLGLLMFFNPRFMTNYVTTIGKTIYFPTQERFLVSPVSTAATLAHELVHVLDSKRNPFFAISYLMPQIFALGIFGTFFSPWFLLCVLFLLPLPAPFRAHWEKRGYMMTIATTYWFNNLTVSDEWLSKQFVSPQTYLSMWPFKKQVLNEKHRIEHLLKTNQNLEIPLEEEMKKIFS